MANFFEVCIENDSKSLVKKYYIRFSGDDKVWIGNQDGEGMGVKNKDIFDMVDKYFKENF